MTSNRSWHWWWCCHCILGLEPSVTAAGANFPQRNLTRPSWPPCLPPQRFASMTPNAHSSSFGWFLIFISILSKWMEKNNLFRNGIETSNYFSPMLPLPTIYPATALFDVCRPTCRLTLGSYPLFTWISNLISLLYCPQQLALQTCHSAFVSSGKARHNMGLLGRSILP